MEPWTWQHRRHEELPKHLQLGLQRLVHHVYLARHEDLPPCTVSIGYTDSRPGCSWVNIIELEDGWNMVSHRLSAKPP